MSASTVSSTSGEATAPGVRRLVFLHGFTQAHHHWHRCAEEIAGHLAEQGSRPVNVFADLPGHGLSAADRSGIDETVDELAHGTGPATFVGYSMGGRIALLTALARPDAVERLVLVGATAGIGDDAQRAERCRDDAERAERVERIGVTRFVDEWLTLPLFATLPPDRRGLDVRRRNTAAGLAHSLRTAGTGAQRPVWDDLEHLEVPTLLIAGALDAKFTDVAHRMAERLPSATVAIVEGAGHAVHTERPGDVADLVARWLTDDG